VDEEPLLPLDEQVENSSVYYQAETGTWFLFTNHVGVSEIGEYTDAVWVYWSRDPRSWDTRIKAVVLDGAACTWSKTIIGAPSVIRRGNRLHLFYDGCEEGNLTHYHRQIGMAELDLPLVPPG